jgi:hypothetical protein
VSELLAEVERHPGVSLTDLDALRDFSPDHLPEDYMSFLQWSDGAEGYAGGGAYVRLWSARDVIRFNRAYQVPEFIPGLLLFGTDASVMGYGLDWSTNEVRCVEIELAALDREYVHEMAESFTGLIRLLASDVAESGPPESHRPPDWLRGNVVHEKHPIVLGGPPDDPDNRVLVPVDQHPPLCVLNAKILREVRRKSGAC